MTTQRAWTAREHRKVVQTQLYFSPACTRQLPPAQASPAAPPPPPHHVVVLGGVLGALDVRDLAVGSQRNSVGVGADLAVAQRADLLEERWEGVGSVSWRRT